MHGDVRTRFWLRRDSRSRRDSDRRDAPPLLPVSDPAVLSREVDGVGMVIRAGKTQRDVALRAKKILDDAGANLLGVIVNNVDDVLPYYYGHTYYRYGEGHEDGAAGKDGGEHPSAPPRQKRMDARPKAKASAKNPAKARTAGSTG